MGRLSNTTMGKHNIKIEDKNPNKKAFLQAYCDTFINQKSNNKFITISNDKLFIHNKQIIVYSPNTTTQEVFKNERGYIVSRQDLHRSIQEKIEQFYGIKTEKPVISVSEVSQNALTMQKVLNIIPQLADTFRTPQNNPNHIYDVGTHTMYALRNTPNDLIVRLAVLLHDIGKPVTKSVGAECNTVKKIALFSFFY